MFLYTNNINNNNNDKANNNNNNNDNNKNNKKNNIKYNDSNNKTKNKNMKKQKTLLSATTSILTLLCFETKRGRLSRSEVDPAAPSPLEKGLGSFRRDRLLHNRKRTPPLVVER